jgi:hypothetical protein
MELVEAGGGAVRGKVLGDALTELSKMREGIE